ncbi:hypothetical protein FKM82_016191 [Ascaphus truei]
MHRILLLASLLLQIFTATCENEETTTTWYFDSTDFLDYSDFEVIYHTTESGGSAIQPSRLSILTLLLYFTWFAWHRGFPVAR